MSLLASALAALGITHGALVGEVTSESAVVWARVQGEGALEVTLTPPDGGRPIRAVARVRAENDFAGRIKVSGLQPATRYTYRVSEGEAGSHQGSFRTAPSPETRAPVRFAWGGDVGGQNVCRDGNEGYPIFRTIRAVEKDLDFFIALGDMIYADDLCQDKGRYGNSQVPGGGPAADLPAYWAHWKYNREDPGFQELFATTAYYAVWDDHEVVNDFGPLHDTRQEKPYTAGLRLLPLGLKAFLDYNPLLPPSEDPQRLYRAVRWGKGVEIFFLDNRQYRDANAAPDLPSRPKTMLGREQLRWLRERLSGSDATWKIIVSSVPLSLPTGSRPGAGRDGWASGEEDSGFEQELRAILTLLRERAVANVVFITTDVHFAEVFRYRPFPETPDFEIHEFITGPLNAGLFPFRELDRSFNPESLFFHGPAGAEAVRSWEEAKRWFNYGALAIDERGTLTLRIVNALGEAVFTKTLLPQGVSP
jgi:alkaline phosphatase D